MTWMVYMLTPDGKRHNLARTVDVNNAVGIAEIVNNVLLIVDGVGEVKYEQEESE